MFICTLSPSSKSISETVSTLSFADRAMQVQVQAKRNTLKGNTVNYLGSGGGIDDSTVRRYKNEIQMLRDLVRFLSSSDNHIKEIVDGYVVEGEEEHADQQLKSLDANKFIRIKNSKKALESELKRVKKELAEEKAQKREILDIVYQHAGTNITEGTIFNNNLSVTDITDTDGGNDDARDGAILDMIYSFENVKKNVSPFVKSRLLEYEAKELKKKYDTYDELLQSQDSRWEYLKKHVDNVNTALTTTTSSPASSNGSGDETNAVVIGLKDRIAMIESNIHLQEEEIQEFGKLRLHRDIQMTLLKYLKDEEKMNTTSDSTDKKKTKKGNEGDEKEDDGAKPMRVSVRQKMIEKGTWHSSTGTHTAAQHVKVTFEEDVEDGNATEEDEPDLLQTI